MGLDESVIQYLSGKKKNFTQILVGQIQKHFDEKKGRWNEALFIIFGILDPNIPSFCDSDENIIFENQTPSFMFRTSFIDVKAVNHSQLSA